MNIQHHIHTLEPYLSYIRSGKKKIEGRVFSPRYQKMKVGDLICFYHQKDEVVCRIFRISPYPTFREMLLSEGLKNMVPNAKTIEEGISIYRGFEGFAETERLYGAVALGIELLSSACYTGSDSKIGLCQGSALNLNQVKPSPKQPNFKKLGDRGGFKVNGCLQQPEPIFESRAI